MKFLSIWITATLALAAIPYHMEAARTLLILDKPAPIAKDQRAHKRIRRIRRVKRIYHPLTTKQILLAALRIDHEPRTWVKALIWLAWQESKDKAHAADAVQVWSDGRWQHAEGLMQMLPSTFWEFHLAHRADIWNRLDNAVASVRYIRWRYGTPRNIPNLFSAYYSGY